MSTASGSPTTDWAIYTRDVRRLRLKERDEARVEFVHPESGGWRLTCALVDVSEDGLAFELSDARDAVPLNSVLDHLVLRVGDYEIRGAFEATHVTVEEDGRAICGGRFRPAAERDRRLLRGFIDLDESG